MSSDAQAGFRLSPQQAHLAATADEARYPQSAALFVCDGPLDLAALPAALAQVVARHEILRTVFRRQRELTIPFQIILGDAPAALHTEDLTGFDAGAQGDALDRAFQAATAHLTEAGEPPVLRSTVFVLGPGHHALLFALPALAADAASFPVLAEDLLRALAGQPAAEEPIQYADATEFQHDLLTGEDEAATTARANWQAQAHTPLILPLETEAASIGSESIAVPLDPVIATHLRATAQAAGFELSDLLLAAWHALLHRFTAEPRTTVLALTPGREYDELKTAVGPFARYTPVSLDFDETTRFDQLLRQAARLTQQARTQSDWFLPGSSTTAPALGFEYHDLRTPLEIGTLVLTQRRVSAPLERLKLSLIATDTAAGLTLALACDPARYDAATLAQSLATLLEGIATLFEAPVHTLPLLSGGARESLLAQGAGPAVDDPATTITAQLATGSPATGGETTSPSAQDDRIAVRCGEAALTYRELHAQSNQLAHHLAAQGIAPGSLVGLCTHRSAATIVALVAILKAGAAYVPLSPDQPAERFARQTAGLQLLLTESTLLPLTESFPGPRIALDQPTWSHLPSTAPDDRATPDDLAYILYTSGSTGTPKGVEIRHRNLVNYATHIVRTLALDAAEPLHYGLVSTLAADLGNTVLYPALMTGGTLHVLPYETATDPALFAAYTAQHPLDVLKIVPSHLTALLDGAGPAVLPRHSLILGGEALKPALAARIFSANAGCNLINHYGPTETTVGSLMLPVLPGQTTATIPIGRPIANTDAYLLDAGQQLLPPGLIGELYLSGAGVARGYLELPEATAARFLPDPFHAGATMYRTGDLARWLPDGTLEFLGRADDQLKLRGFRVEPGEIEALLLAQPEVRQAVVLARPREHSGDLQLLAYVVLDRQQGTTPEALRTILKSQLPDYMVPAAIVPLAKLPLTQNGKLDRAALPAPETRTEKTFLAPATPTEELIAQIWSDVLKIPRLSTDENFFDLGGHSLLATQVISRIRRTLGVDLPLRTLFDAPTVAGLAARIPGAPATPVIPAAPRDRGPLPLSFAQQRLWILDQMQPGNATYNIPRTLRLRGPLNRPALAAALNEILRRHESLRTAFPTVAGEPLQHIHPTLTLPLPVEDLTQTPDPEAHAHTLAAQEAATPFNLAQAPLLRATLLQLAPEDQVLLLTMHHIVSDGWSATVFMEELRQLYDAFTTNSPATLPPLTLQYADYAAWQRAWLTGPTLEAQLDFWRSQLAGAPPVLLLPADHSRPDRPTFAGALHTTRLDAETTAALRALCRAEGLTVFMVLLAGYQVLLSRLSGQPQVVVGTDSANRFSVETERMIGFFINLLPLAADLSANPTFAALLAQTRETTLACYAHQEMPFDKIVEALRPDRTLTHNPILQTLFVMQNAPRAARQLAGLAVSGFASRITQSKFDIAVFAVEREATAELGETIELLWVYSTELFEPATLATMAGSYTTLLAHALVHPETRVQSLPLATEAQRDEVRKQQKQSRMQSLRSTSLKTVALTEEE